MLTFRRTTRSRRRLDERGVAAAFSAMAITSILAVGGLVLDGSLAYTQRRDMQNAADASVMAATRQLDRVKFSTTPAPPSAWTQVDSTATAVAEQNDAGTVECTVVRADRTPIGDCASQAAVLDSEAVGIRVVTTQSRRTTFGLIAGPEEVTARAEAVATIQPLIGSGSPFVVCGTAPGQDILNPDGTIDVVAAGAMGTIDLQSAQVPTCGAGSAFKGKIEPGFFTVPGWVHGDNGNGFEADISTTVLGTNPCPAEPPFDDCGMLLPVADVGQGNGTDIYLHAVAWAIFNVTGDGHGNPKYQGYFVDTGLVSGGVTSTGPVRPGTVRAVKLAA